MEPYDFREIEPKWQRRWAQEGIYRVGIDPGRPKYYVLDMFPYPSGAGLHVGHPLGYIASDIYSRYKRQKGFNVLHPMGFDAFGLPAEQYAIQTGQHPAVTTGKNIAVYKEQLEKLGFSFDWDREVVTSDPGYYKWTQWAFEQMFEHYYDTGRDRAVGITELEAHFDQFGTQGVRACGTKELRFSAEEWKNYTPKERADVLQNYRLAFQADTLVNWCEGLGTVLANDEVVNGLSERGGFPVEQKLMRQWLLRVSAYAERLLGGLDGLEWSDSLKEIQRNWIGRSQGATLFFPIEGHEPEKLEVFTTRADTIFGVTFMVLAPEHELLQEITTPEQRAEVEAYVAQTKKRSERERMADTKRVSGAFTGAYAVNPFNGKQIPIWISDYVLAGYGTGAIMAVPAHDSRDYAFAKHFGLPIVPIIACDVSSESYDAKEGKLIDSDFLTGLEVRDAIPAMFRAIEERGVGYKKINYRLRDAIFSRQRYWGEPFPVVYDGDGIARLVPQVQLPVQLPEIQDFTPTKDGQPPLARVPGWQYETSTMPGFAGSSAYYLRYMDPHNDRALVGRDADEYWRDVDLYVGGVEHATGHLIYSRYWNMFLYDIGAVVAREPFKKLVNQGMIQGRSNFVYRIIDDPADMNTFVSYNLREGYKTQEIHVDVNIVKNDLLDMEAFRQWRPEFADAKFVVEEGDKYVCGWAVEKMSKSMFNVVNPDYIVQRYGADTLRLYEMFLGPLEQSKPWDTNGIDGVHKFLRKFWRLFTDREGNFALSPEKAEALHRAIKKVGTDIEAFSFNTAVSAFMICLNELAELKTTSREVLEPFTVLLSPFAPHICEELWRTVLGNDTSICVADYPVHQEKYLEESSFEYPVSFNGKMRFKRAFATTATASEIEQAIRADEQTANYTPADAIKKVIVVPGKIINIVC